MSAAKPGETAGIEGAMETGAKPHWGEYLIEGAYLAVFMISAAGFATLLQHPASPMAAVFHTPFGRRVVMGLAMGATAVALIYSPLGARSGAHMNPAVTLTFLRLGKVSRTDAAGYVLAQFAGGTVGIVAATAILGGLPADPSVNYVATLPGYQGNAVAFVAEAAIAFLMMAMVLSVSNTPRIARFTGLGAGMLVAGFITFEAPLSGMSMNPARTLGSNLLAHASSTLWIYFVAPLVGMLLAAECVRRMRRSMRIHCAKLYHPRGVPCIFRCAYAALPEEIV